MIGSMRSTSSSITLEFTFVEPLVLLKQCETPASRSTRILWVVAMMKLTSGYTRFRATDLPPMYSDENQCSLCVQWTIYLFTFLSQDVCKHLMKVQGQNV